MRPLRLLHVEDMEGDVLLVERHLRHSGWSVEWTRVRDRRRAPRGRSAARGTSSSPTFQHAPVLSALQALEIVQASERAGTPFIVLSGSVGEQAAIEVLLPLGADDFVDKEQPRPARPRPSSVSWWTPRSASRSRRCSGRSQRRWRLARS